MAEDVRTLLKQAIDRHRAGELRVAEPLYRQVLDANPDDLDTMYLMGTVQLQLGQFSESIELLQRVAEQRPDVPDAQNNLGVAYKANGQWEEAARAFEAAIKAQPEYDQAFFNLGVLMQDRKLYPDAEKCFRHALKLNPGDLQCRFHLGNVLAAQKQWAEAEECFRQAADQDPGNLDGLVNLGFVLAKQERLDEAVEVYSRVLAANSDYHQVHNSLSYVYERCGKLEAAVESARRAVEIQPGYADGYNNLGTALRSLHRLDEACDHYRQATDLQSGFALAQFNYGTTKLLRGDYAAGWPGYAHYTAAAGLPPREFPQPRWDGAPIAGRRLLVYADQGIGDTLQFVRFLAHAKERSGAEVVFECPPELQRLLERQAGIDRLVLEGEAVVDVDFQVSLSSLAGLLGVTLESVAAEVGSLTSPVPLTPELQELIAGADAAHYKVGLVWQGNPEQARDVVRSCRLEKFLPLAEVNGVSLFSLQTGEAGREQMQPLEEHLPLTDLGAHLRDFGETAAVMQRLDLIITIDTAAAHLAGSLARPVWTLLCHTPDWRWLLDRDDSPWYPTMRLFRQPVWGDWDAVIREVTAELERFVSTAHKGTTTETRRHEENG